MPPTAEGGILLIHPRAPINKILTTDLLQVKMFLFVLFFVEIVRGYKNQLLNIISLCRFRVIIVIIYKYHSGIKVNTLVFIYTHVLS